MTKSPNLPLTFLSIIRQLYPQHLNQSFSNLKLQEKRDVFRNVIRSTLGNSIHSANKNIAFRGGNISSGTNNEANEDQIDLTVSSMYNSHLIHSIHSERNNRHETDIDLCLKNSIFYPNRQEKLLLMKHLGISASELSELLIDARKWSDRQSRKPIAHSTSSTRSRIITAQQKDHIRQFLESRNYKKLTMEEVEKLQAETKLSKTQLYNQISLLKDSAAISIQDKGVSSYQHDEVDENPTNLHPIGKYVIQKHSSNPQVYILNSIVGYIKHHSIDIMSRNFKFSSADLNNLRVLTGIPKFKIRSIIRKIRLGIERGIITSKKKEMIQGWMKEHNITSKPPLWQLAELSSRLQLGKLQIQGIISRILDKNGEITMETKEFLRQFVMSRINMKQSSSTSPNTTVPKLSLSSDEIDYLQQNTGLSRQQIHNQLRYLVPRNSITKERKSIVRKWLKDHDFQNPTSFDMEALSHQTGLSNHQLMHLIWTIKDKPGIINEDKKKFIKQFLERNKFKRLSSEHIEELQKQTQLSRQQLYKQISVMRDPPGIITSDIKEKIKDWCLENHIEENTLNMTSIRELQKISGLSRDQVRRLVKSLNPQQVAQQL